MTIVRRDDVPVAAGGAGRLPKWAKIAAFGLLLAAAMNGVVTRYRTTTSVGLNTPIHLDDFYFTVVSAGEDTSFSSAGLRPTTGNDLYFVTLRIDNRARRVPFTFSERSAALLDGQGHTYHVEPAVQRKLEAIRGLGDPTASPIPAGTSVTKELVFQVPVKTQRRRLSFQAGGLIGDFLESMIYGRKEIALP
jgi:hypothetical protein